MLVNIMESDCEERIKLKAIQLTSTLVGWLFESSMEIDIVWFLLSLDKCF
jgi:hypothetical protein